MKAVATDLPGVIHVEPRVYGDERGYFYEAFSKAAYAEAGITAEFVQDNVSMSARGCLRGLHLQHPHGQGKLVSCLTGEVFDVAVDVRVGSPTFLGWYGATLSARGGGQLYIPPGFAHGFCVLSEQALFHYKCTDAYHPECELSVAWNDPDIGIAWPIREPILSAKDAMAKRVCEMARDRLPDYGKPL